MIQKILAFFSRWFRAGRYRLHGGPVQVKLVRSLINDCEKCQAHDDRTKELYAELFSGEERVFLALLIGNSIKMRTAMKHAPSPKGLSQAQRVGRALAAQRDIDFASTVLGKIYISFSDKDRETADEALAKIGIEGLQMNHQKCPHKEARADAVQA